MTDQCSISLTKFKYMRMCWVGSILRSKPLMNKYICSHFKICFTQSIQQPSSGVQYIKKRVYLAFIVKVIGNTATKNSNIHVGSHHWKC